MPFDPKTLTDIPEGERAALDREAGTQTKADAHALIASLIKQAADGDDHALRSLTASCAASMAAEILHHIGKVCTTDPNGEEIRAMIAGVKGVRSLVVMAALQAAQMAYMNLKPGDPKHAAFQLLAAHSLSAEIWRDVRDTINAQHQHAGTYTCPSGASIYMVPKK